MRSASLIRPVPAMPPLAARAAPAAVVMPVPARNAIHGLILAAVWLAFALSSIVFSEPAPVDAMFLGLVALLPAAGLTTFTPASAVYIALWSVVAASGFLSATVSSDVPASMIFTAVSLYLYVFSFVLAAFVANNPIRHTTLIFGGWSVAALVAALLGLIGYFQLIPGAAELFTKFTRAAGTFKDPNVFGPFLVPPFLYALHLILNRSWSGAILPAALAAILALANLLSFSRGAWINLGLALALYGVLAYTTSRSADQRRKIVSIVLAGVAVVALVTFAVMQNEKMASFLAERASLTQSYDVGPDGRFGGQEKAVRLLLDNPLGIGAGQFALRYHHEEVHNVFLSMILNAGWLGGLIYSLIVFLTIAIGAMHLRRDTNARPLFVIVYAAFVATALEGIIIDSDHWRSFYILMAMVWGMVSSPHQVEEA